MRKLITLISLVFIYLFLALIVSLFWLKWAHEDNKLKDAEKAKIETPNKAEEEAT